MTRSTRLWAVPGVLVLLTALVTVAIGRPKEADAKADANPGARDVIVHLFEWPWASVASECTNVLGPKGFGGVQVSPPQEHVVLPGNGYPWWQDYQPVSYQLATRRGNRAAFASMVSTCHAAGVKIYVDAVINHMAGGASTGTGSGGSTYSHYAYPAVRVRHQRLPPLRPQRQRRHRQLDATAGRCRTASWSTSPTSPPRPRTCGASSPRT